LAALGFELRASCLLRHSTTWTTPTALWVCCFCFCFRQSSVVFISFHKVIPAVYNILWIKCLVSFSHFIFQ
jgi:hypothetical protein